MKQLLFLLLLFTFQHKITAQQLNKIHISTMVGQYQSCLDTSTNKAACAQSFYNQMDSCLDVSYRQLAMQLDSLGKKQLSQEKVKWQNKRVKEFKTIEDNAVNKGKEQELIQTNLKAVYLKERVLVLISRMKPETEQK